MPKYECPECRAILRRAEAVKPGKKIRCPKCEAVFPAQELPEEEPKPEPPAAGGGAYALAEPPPAPNVPDKKPAVDDDEDSNPYSVMKEKDDHVAPEVHLGSLRDRFAKSSIGPAMFRTVIPSNWLLRLGLFTCVWCVVGFIVGVFPLIFCEATPVRPFIRTRADIMLFASIMFFCGSLMCIGASKMHEVTSYPWAIVGSLMSLVIYIPVGILWFLFVTTRWGPIIAIIITLPDLVMCCTGIWCLVTLTRKDVKAGFKERAEEVKPQWES